RGGCVSTRHNNIDGAGRTRPQSPPSAGASLRPAILDCDGASLDSAEFVQSLHQGSNPSLMARAEPALKKPMVSSLPGCYARAATGHAAAPTNGETLSRFEQQRDERATTDVDCHLTLPWKVMLLRPIGKSSESLRMTAWVQRRSGSDGSVAACRPNG